MKKKFYKKAKPKPVKKFPINSRFITEKVHSDHVVFFTGIFFIFLAILILSIDLNSNYQKQKSLANEKIKILNDLLYWQDVVRDKPNYRDGYFSLAILYFQLKDYSNSTVNLEKAMLIDPNFEKGKELEKLLNKY